VAITGQVLVPLVLKVTAKTGVMVLVYGKMGDVIQNRVNSITWAENAGPNVIPDKVVVIGVAQKAFAARQRVAGLIFQTDVMGHLVEVPDMNALLINPAQDLPTEQAMLNKN